MLRGSSFLERQTRMKNVFLEVSFRLKDNKYSIINISQRLVARSKRYKVQNKLNCIHILKTFTQELNHEFPYDIVKGNNLVYLGACAE